MRNGQRYNRWTVVEAYALEGKDTDYALCICTCGTMSRVQRGSIVSGRSQGCYRCRKFARPRARGVRPKIHPLPFGALGGRR